MPLQSRVFEVNYLAQQGIAHILLLLAKTLAINLFYHMLIFGVIRISGFDTLLRHLTLGIQQSHLKCPLNVLLYSAQ